MKQQEYQLMRTLRVKNDNLPGVLGKLATAIGKAGGNIGNIRTVSMGHKHIVRDFDVFVDDEAHLNRILESITKVPEINLMEVRDEVLELHLRGKIKMVSTVPINSVSVLRKIYTPGVADVCRHIQREPNLKYTYTTICDSVAIVTDGTRVLGLGNIGAVAGLPVMEGKAALLQQFAGITGIPILLSTTDTEEIISTVKNIACSFGGIQLEDISSPRCFDIYTRLRDELTDTPVMHDDQQGTATVTLAAVINACKITGIDIKKATVGQIGLGAAGLVIAEMIYKYSGKPVLGTARSEASKQRHVARGGIASTLPEIMQKSDIVVGCSGVKGLISPEMIRKGQVILALTNPEPEIEPSVALKHGAILAADGKSVNNLLGFPGIWRGTLDCRASKINEQMMLAAAIALAQQTPKNELMPYILDAKVHKVVTQAVAKAAMESGVARLALDEDYFE